MNELCLLISVIHFYLRTFMLLIIPLIWMCTQSTKWIKWMSNEWQIKRYFFCEGVFFARTITDWYFVILENAERQIHTPLWVFICIFSRPAESNIGHTLTRGKGNNWIVGNIDSEPSKARASPHCQWPVRSQIFIVSKTFLHNIW